MGVGRVEKKTNVSNLQWGMGGDRPSSWYDSKVRQLRVRECWKLAKLRAQNIVTLL